jgi:hypothetical protein
MQQQYRCKTFSTYSGAVNTMFSSKKRRTFPENRPRDAFSEKNYFLF